MSSESKVLLDNLCRELAVKAMSLIRHDVGPPALAYFQAVSELEHTFGPIIRRYQRRMERRNKRSTPPPITRRKR